MTSKTVNLYHAGVLLTFGPPTDPGAIPPLLRSGRCGPEAEAA